MVLPWRNNLLIIHPKTHVPLTLIFFGALLSLAFAPVNMPGFATISLACFFYQLRKAQSLSKSFLNGWLYGFSFFCAGTSWIYISIHSYGQAEPWLAFILTILFCGFMGLYLGFFGLLFHGLLQKRRLLEQSLGFSVLWVLLEYLRANLFTGFPWLSLGYSQTTTPMRYLAPIVGVYGLSFLVALSGCLLVMACLFSKQHKKWHYPALLIIGIYILPQVLASYHWTKPLSSKHQKIPVSIIQGNIAEDEKWLPGAYEKTIRHYLHLTKNIPRHNSPPNTHETRLIVWPEGAIPVPYPQSKFFLAHLSSFIKKQKATLVTGIPYEATDASNQYYNAIMVLGNSSGKYFKHHLVPFGEYLPASIFRDIAQYFDMPIYETSRGDFHQPLLNLEQIPTLPFICYEIAYSDILLNALPAAKLLITISDDAWFGHSMARAQHLQMAQMRSLQSGRYQIVATNNGISAIIDAQGEILLTVPSFETYVLNGYVKAMSGRTPWSYIGDNVVVLFLSLIFCGLWFRRKESQV